MANIEFKTKIREVQYVDGSFAWLYVPVPAITRNHCDMAAFRQHPRFGGFANSDMFPAMIKRAFSDRKIGDSIRLDAIPDNVAIDCTGYLAVVTVTL